MFPSRRRPPVPEGPAGSVRTAEPSEEPPFAPWRPPEVACRWRPAAARWQSPSPAERAAVPAARGGRWKDRHRRRGCTAGRPPGRLSGACLSAGNAQPSSQLSSGCPAATSRRTIPERTCAGPPSLCSHLPGGGGGTQGTTLRTITGVGKVGALTGRFYYYLNLVTKSLEEEFC